MESFNHDVIKEIKDIKRLEFIDWNPTKIMNTINEMIDKLKVLQSMIK